MISKLNAGAPARRLNSQVVIRAGHVHFAGARNPVLGHQRVGRAGRDPEPVAKLGPAADAVGVQAIGAHHLPDCHVDAQVSGEHRFRHFGSAAGCCGEAPGGALRLALGRGLGRPQQLVQIEVDGLDAQRLLKPGFVHHHIGHPGAIVAYHSQPGAAERSGGGAGAGALDYLLDGRGIHAADRIGEPLAQPPDIRPGPRETAHRGGHGDVEVQEGKGPKEQGDLPDAAGQRQGDFFGHP